MTVGNNDGGLPEVHKLALIRYEKGYTVRGLAEAAGVVPSTIYKIEHGQPASMATLVKLAKVLEIPLAEMLPFAEGVLPNPKNQAVAIAV